MRISKGSSATTGYLLFSAMSIITFALALQDPMFLVFAIPIILVFVLAAARGRGDVDRDLAGIGWTNRNLEMAVPLGIVGGMAAFVFGGLVVQTEGIYASIVPDFSALGKVTTASVIPPAMATSINILSQWFVVAPSEEVGYRVLAPFAGMAVFKNMVVAYIVGTLMWIMTHVPTFTVQKTPMGMYFVLVLLSIIAIALFVFTGNIMSAIIMHGVFNTGVILSTSGADMMAYYVIFSIALVLSAVWIFGRGKEGGKK